MKQDLKIIIYALILFALFSGGYTVIVTQDSMTRFGITAIFLFAAILLTLRKYLKKFIAEPQKGKYTFYFK